MSSPVDTDRRRPVALGLLAAEALLRGRRTALLWLLAGGGGLIELAINVITLCASVATLRWAWRRRTLLA